MRKRNVAFIQAQQYSKLKTTLYLPNFVPIVFISIDWLMGAAGQTVGTEHIPASGRFA